MIRHSSIIAKILIILAWQMDSIFKIIYTQTECNATPIEVLECRIFFIILAISLAIWSLKDKNNFFEFLFMEFAFYNVFDELMGLGSLYQWYELPIFLIMLVITYFKFYKNNDRNSSNKICFCNKVDSVDIFIIN